MRHVHRLTFIVNLALLTGCAASEDPLAMISGSAASSVADDGSLSAASLTLPFSDSYNGILSAFTVTQTGSGRAGHFENTSTTNPRAALTAQTAGTSNALYVRSYGTGVTALIENTNPNHFSDMLRLENDGGGILLNVVSTRGQAIRAENSGTSGAGYFAIPNPDGYGHALHAVNRGSGAGLAASASGTGYAVSIASTTAKPAMWAHTSGTSSVGLFEVLNQNNVAPVLSLVHKGTGVALMADQAGGFGDIALFRTNAVNQARIDRNGTGFFNGGTQTGGADVAEAFEVDGNVAHYRPGDVLVISAHNDRKVSRSAEPYSPRVIGVYATKPGVLLTERGIDDSLDDMIPVAVIGVLPTRVSVENGAIRRGDILVTAATPGHAMRTDPVTVQGIKLYPSGAILGKALENFAGPGTGVIRVLVNVK